MKRIKKYKIALCITLLTTISFYAQGQTTTVTVKYGSASSAPGLSTMTLPPKAQVTSNINTTLWGGGGGGGRMGINIGWYDGACASGGGGGGGKSCATFAYTSPLTIVVGAGGAGVPSDVTEAEASTRLGETGGTSRVTYGSTSVYAYGGTGGESATVTRGIGLGHDYADWGKSGTGGTGNCANGGAGTAASASDPTWDNNASGTSGGGGAAGGTNCTPCAAGTANAGGAAIGGIFRNTEGISGNTQGNFPGGGASGTVYVVHDGADNQRYVYPGRRGGHGQVVVSFTFTPKKTPKPSIVRADSCLTNHASNVVLRVEGAMSTNTYTWQKETTPGTWTNLSPTGSTYTVTSPGAYRVVAAKNNSSVDDKYTFTNASSVTVSNTAYATGGTNTLTGKDPGTPSDPITVEKAILTINNSYPIDAVNEIVFIPVSSKPATVNLTSAIVSHSGTGTSLAYSYDEEREVLVSNPGNVQITENETVYYATSTSSNGACHTQYEIQVVYGLSLFPPSAIACDEAIPCEKTTAADIMANDVSICPGATATLQAIASEESGIEGAVFRWYDGKRDDAVLLSEAATYVTPALSEATEYYVSISAAGFCETSPSNRKKVKVTLKPRVEMSFISAEDKVRCAGATVSLSANCAITGATYRWYAGNTAGAQLLATGANYTPNPQPTINTTYYISASGTNYCENLPEQRRPVEIRMGAAAPPAPTSISFTGASNQEVSSRWDLPMSSAYSLNTTVTAVSGATSYYWTSSSGLSLTSGNGHIHAAFRGTSTGTQTVYAYSVNSDGCRSTGYASTQVNVVALDERTLVGCKAAALARNPSFTHGLWEYIRYTGNITGGNAHDIYVCVGTGSKINKYEDWFRINGMTVWFELGGSYGKTTGMEYRNSDSDTPLWFGYETSSGWMDAPKYLNRNNQYEVYECLMCTRPQLDRKKLITW